MEIKDTSIHQLDTFIENNPSVWHLVQHMADILDERGFRRINMVDSWSLQEGEHFYVNLNDSAIIAGIVGRQNSFRMLSAHGDSPGFRLKPIPEKGDGYMVRMGAEPYGGMIMSSWMDRPLRLCGRVYVRGENVFLPKVKLVSSSEPWCIMPNLCIHFNRKLNNGYEWKVNKDLVPIFEDRKMSPLQSFWESQGIDQEEILTFDLSLVPMESPQRFAGEHWLSAPRLDNLGMVHAGLSALLESEIGEAHQLFVVFDHEEVGSQSPQGAKSSVFRDVLERLVMQHDHDIGALSRAMSRSFMISLDQAHGKHPNYLSEMDVQHSPVLGGGPVIKMAAHMSYASEAYGAAVIRSLAERVEVPLQLFYNRSDIHGGTTLGPLLSHHLSVPTVDMGNPILAMHSVRELADLRDQEQMIRLLKNYLQT